MYKHKLTTLKNGLKVVTVPMPQVESMTIMVGVGAGSRYENEKNNGITHFLEHMVFKGTREYPTSLDITTASDEIGAIIGASTGKEFTRYFIKSIPKHQEIAFDILHELVFESKLNTKEIEKEREVINGEIDMYKDTPSEDIHNVFDLLMYGLTPLGRYVLGEKKIIKLMKREDFLDYQNRFYFPKNMVILGVGKIEEKKFLDLVKHYFSREDNRNKEGFKSIKVVQDSPRVKLERKRTSQAHLCLGASGYSYSHPDRFVMDVLATILGLGMSSRLFIELREKKGLGYYINTFSVNFIDNGYLVTHSGVHANRIEEAIRVILNEYRKITREKVSKRELKKAKEFLKGRLILGLETSDSVANEYLLQSLLEEKIRDPQEILKLIDKVTAEDIQRVAKDIFKTEKLNLAVIGPYKDEEKFKKLLKF